jgi:3-oxoacyl-[acyl-carrier protein] reductase
MKTEGIRAIVTGASSGIGLATAKALAAAGAACVGVMARSQDKLDAAVQAVSQDQPAAKILPLLADVRDREALAARFAAFVEAAGGLDVLVNNAGVLLDGAMMSFSFRGAKRYSLEDWEATLDTNVTGVFHCCQLAVEQMVRKRCKGVIVNISSLSRLGRIGQVAYSASKGAVASMTFTLAQELAPYGIRCVAVAPGFIETRLSERMTEESRKATLGRIAAGRMGTPEEIAHGVLFSIENDYFNGRVLELDGGVMC